MSSRVGNVIVKCQICGKEFKAYQYVINQGRAKFCSRECYYESLKVTQLCAPVAEKKCNQCGQVKPLSEFHKKKLNKSFGLSGICKECNTKRAQEYYYANKDRCCKRISAHDIADRKQNPEKHSKKHSDRVSLVRSEALAFFGPCACCGETRWEFLSIDHINGHGNEGRKSRKHRTGWELLYKFHRMGWPEELKDTFRLLCMNCNFSIGHYGYCPHHPERKHTYFDSKTKTWVYNDQ